MTIPRSTITVHAASKAVGMTRDELLGALDAANSDDVITVTTAWSGKIRTITVATPKPAESADNDPDPS